MAENASQEAIGSKKLLVTPGPHLFETESVGTIMWTVAASLLPAAAVGIYFFGLPAVGVIAACTLTAVAAEYAGEKFVLGKRRPAAFDGSAFLTGLLLAFCLPPTIALWKAAVGSAVAVFVTKTVFGGLGYNVFNPALIGRAVLLAAWPAAMTTWTLPRGGYLAPQAVFDVDAVSGATPLAALKNAVQTAAREGQTLSIEKLTPHWGDLKALVLGNVGGSIGETCALALLVGGLWLLWRKIISWHIPVVFIGTVFLLSAAIQIPRALGGDVASAPAFLLKVGLFHALSGGLFLGAWFMATDMVTSPITGKGKMLFAAGAGFLVVLIRSLGGYPEGVCYSILLMNITVPLIDRFMIPKKFGSSARFERG